jgi:hypothetical protein
MKNGTLLACNMARDGWLFVPLLMLLSVGVRGCEKGSMYVQLGARRVVLVLCMLSTLFVASPRPLARSNVT